MFLRIFLPHSLGDTYLLEEGGLLQGPLSLPATWGRRRIHWPPVGSFRLIGSPHLL